jgi:hypothetical protein
LRNLKRLEKVFWGLPSKKNILRQKNPFCAFCLHSKHSIATTRVKIFCRGQFPYRGNNMPHYYSITHYYNKNAVYFRVSFLGQYCTITSHWMFESLNLQRKKWVVFYFCSKNSKTKVFQNDCNKRQKNSFQECCHWSDWLTDNWHLTFDIGFLVTFLSDSAIRSHKILFALQPHLSSDYIKDLK